MGRVRGEPIGSRRIERVRVKICGITRPEDGVAAVRAGADAIGLNFYPKSRRFVDPVQASRIVAAVPPLIDIVGVFVDASANEIRRTLAQSGVRSVQLHGSEPPAMLAELAPLRSLRAFRLCGAGDLERIGHYLEDCRSLGRLPAGLLLDAYRPGEPGGTGATWDWGAAVGADFGVPLVLAGGLTPANVGEAVATLRPFAVDVASGVEAEPGIKSEEKIRAFVAAVRAAHGSGE